MKGYKVFNSDWTCRGFQYEVGKTYKEECSPILCCVGFHFCEKVADCFNFYDFNLNNKVAEVEALGEVVTAEDGRKSCTDEIKIVREVSWEEMLTLANSGKGNTGRNNSGDRNSGNWNSGNYNSGNWNSGNYNSGDRNSGNYNSGNWNKTNHSSGFFCTEEPKVLFFDKECDWTHNRWFLCDARDVLNTMPNYSTCVYTYFSNMTDSEKEAHPEAETTGGYIEIVTATDADRQKWWDELSDENKALVLALPNFDAEKFEEITGIKV